MSTFERIRAGLSVSFKATTDLLFPRRCVYCDQDNLPSAAEALLCEPCSKLLLAGSGPACPACGISLSESADLGLPCGRCQEAPFTFRRTIRLGSYQGQLREAVLRMKHVAQEALASEISRLLWRRHQQQFQELNFDLILPVPMHWLRRMARGTNSPEIMAQSLAGLMRKPCFPRMLKRFRNTHPQASLSVRRRETNVRHAFRIRRGYACDQTKVLLVDDVMTTGATCQELARMLKQAGATHVDVAVVARADGLD